MNDRDTIVIMDEEYNITGTQEVVSGASIVIDGPLKLVLDKILSNNPQFNCYNDLIRESIYLGLMEIINSEIRPRSNEVVYNDVLDGFDKKNYEEIPFEEFNALNNKGQENNIGY